MSVSHAEVCDGVSNCPLYKEDEKYCDMIGVCDSGTHENTPIRQHCLYDIPTNTYLD